MEKLKTFKTNEKRGAQQIAIPTNWLREYLPKGGELELYQDGDKLILTPKKKNPVKAAVK